MGGESDPCVATDKSSEIVRDLDDPLSDGLCAAGLVSDEKPRGDDGFWHLSLSATRMTDRGLTDAK